jgi:transcriptional regulator NrdR family protein
MLIKGLPCPSCGDTDSMVIDSRPHVNGYIRRRRGCVKCGARFTTHETVKPNKDDVMQARSQIDSALNYFDQYIRREL